MYPIKNESRAGLREFESSAMLHRTECRFKQSSRSKDLNQHLKMLSDWDQHYDQLSRGRFEGHITEAWIGGIQIFEERMSQAVLQTVAGRTDRFSLGVFSSLPENARWQGSLLDMTHVASLGQRCSLELSTPRNSTMLGVDIPLSQLQSNEAFFLDDDLRNFVQVSGVTHIGSPKLAANLRHRLSQALLTLSYQPMQLALIEARKQLQSEIICLVGDYVSEVLAQGAYATPTKALKVVARAREYIEQRQDQPITVLDLCKETSTSQRTLQYCFDKVVGTSPAAYLKVVRLNGLRRDLVRTGSSLKIGDIAAQWGFWHLSQFSLDYKRLFGELPSDTVKRRSLH
jgi:AraC family ethanolamine operon transcriptional activator